MGGYSNVEVRTERDLIEQLLYVWCQPVAAGLVDTPDAWPGFKLLPEDFGQTFTFQRPKTAFFGARKPKDHVPTEPATRARELKERKQADEEARARRRRQDLERGRGRRRSNQLERERLRLQNTGEAPRESQSSLPDEVTFKVGVPPGWEDRPLEETRAHFRALLDARVAEIIRLREETGLTSFLGVDAVLEQNPFAAPGDTWPSFKLDPRIAAKCRAVRVALLGELREWRRRYHDARKAWAQVVGPRELKMKAEDVLGDLTPCRKTRRQG
ncbi:MAG: hypothetical protein AB7N76_05180 [Planctomycetota bacterium]